MRSVALVLAPSVLLILACGGGDSVDVEVAPAPEVAPAVAPAAPAAPAAKRLPPPQVDEGPRDADCNIEKPGEWDLMLAPTQAAGGATEVVRGKHGVSETVLLKDGTEVRVVRGGCQHVGETWTVSPPLPKPQIAAMRALIERIDKNPAVSSSLLGCLDAAREAEESGFDCGDAYVSRQTTPDTVEFTWSFAL